MVVNMADQVNLTTSVSNAEIIKNTPPGHSDGAKLTAVLERFVEILK